MRISVIFCLPILLTGLVMGLFTGICFFFSEHPHEAIKPPEPKQELFCCVYDCEGILEENIKLRRENVYLDNRLRWFKGYSDNRVITSGTTGFLRRVWKSKHKTRRGE